MFNKKRIEERQKIRAEIAGKHVTNQAEAAFFWLISESLDDYIEQRIEADKTLEGILTDIQNNIASMAELNRSVLAGDAG